MRIPRAAVRRLKLFGAHPRPGTPSGGSSGIRSRGNSLGDSAAVGARGTVRRARNVAGERTVRRDDAAAAASRPNERTRRRDRSGRDTPATHDISAEEAEVWGTRSGIELGETGVGGLSAMFASGLDVSGPGRATVAAPSLGTTPESTRLSNPTLDPGASPTSFTQRTGSVEQPRQPRSSVPAAETRSVPARRSSAPAARGSDSPRRARAPASPRRRAPPRLPSDRSTAEVYGPTAARRASACGRDARGPRAWARPCRARVPPFPGPAVDRADTPGISPGREGRCSIVWRAPTASRARRMTTRNECRGVPGEPAPRGGVVALSPSSPRTEALLGVGGGRSRGAGTFREERGGARGGARGGPERARRTRRGGVDGPPRTVKRSVPAATVSERVTEERRRERSGARRASGPSRTISARRRDARVTITTSRHRARTSRAREHNSDVRACWTYISEPQRGWARRAGGACRRADFARVAPRRVPARLRPRAREDPTRHATRRDRLRRLSKPRALPRTPAVRKAPRPARGPTSGVVRGSCVGSTNPAARTMFLVPRGDAPESGPFPRNASGFAAAFSSTFTALSNSRRSLPGRDGADGGARRPSSFLRSRRALGVAPRPAGTRGPTAGVEGLLPA